MMAAALHILGIASGIGIIVFGLIGYALAARRLTRGPYAGE
jgi:hypothetical protein